MGASYAITFLLCFSSLSPSNVTVKKAGTLSEEQEESLPTIAIKNIIIMKKFGWHR